MSVILATGNLHKVEEISAITGIAWKSLADFPGAPAVVEDCPTLRGNAVKKAVETARALECPVIADDTGLFVLALGGAPGIYSARYAGAEATYADNNRKLLRSLEGVECRQAEFRCVAAYADPDGRVLTSKGALGGEILRGTRGDRGFGYDPLFFLPQLQKTLAELSADQKNAISHRALAFRALMAQLPEHQTATEE